MNERNRIRYLEEQIKHLENRIDEVLASPYPYTIDAVRTRRDEAEVEGSFTSAGAEYLYGMILEHAVIGDDVIIKGEVLFADEEGETKMTGRGDAFKVIATVIEMTRKIVTDQNIVNKYVENVAEEAEGRDLNVPKMIEVLRFSADTNEPSRVRLYERIAKNVPNFVLAYGRSGYFILFSNTLTPEKVQYLKKRITPLA